MPPQAAKFILLDRRDEAHGHEVAMSDLPEAGPPLQRFKIVDGRINPRRGFPYQPVQGGIGVPGRLEVAA